MMKRHVFLTVGLETITTISQKRELPKERSLKRDISQKGHLSSLKREISKIQRQPRCSLKTGNAGLQASQHVKINLTKPLHYLVPHLFLASQQLVTRANSGSSCGKTTKHQEEQCLIYKVLSIFPWITINDFTRGPEEKCLNANLRITSQRPKSQQPFFAVTLSCCVFQEYDLGSVTH